MLSHLLELQANPLLDEEIRARAAAELPDTNLMQAQISQYQKYIQIAEASIQEGKRRVTPKSSPNKPVDDAPISWDLEGRGDDSDMAATDETQEPSEPTIASQVSMGNTTERFDLSQNDRLGDCSALSLEPESSEGNLGAHEDEPPRKKPWTEWSDAEVLGREPGRFWREGA